MIVNDWFSGFNIQGFGLALITLVIIIAMIVCNKWIRKVTNSYFFWLVIAAFSLIWFVYWKYAPDVKTFFEMKDNLKPMESRSDSFIISSAFLLDCCPFSALALSSLIILDPSRKAARSFAPIAMLGGIMTVFIQMPFDESAKLTLEYIFVGDSVNKCYFYFHAFNLLASIGIMLNTPRYGWKGYALTVLMFVTYYGYVCIVAKTTGCSWHISGIKINEWVTAEQSAEYHLDEGEYWAVTQLLHCKPEVSRAVGLVFLPLAASGVVALSDYVFKRRWWNYGNAFSGKWYNWYDYKRYRVQRII